MNKITPKHVILLVVLGTISIEGASMLTQKRAEAPTPSSAHPLYVADFNNNEILVGASHNIFVGKVIEKIGVTERGVGPETQYKVEVVSNIKGDLRGDVTVNQQGGFKDGILMMVHDNDVSEESETNYFLQAGSTYILATRYNAEEEWYTLNSHNNASKRLSDDKNLSIDELTKMVSTDEKVEAFRKAYPNEILLKADKESGNTLNSFASLPENIRLQILGDSE